MSATCKHVGVALLSQLHLKVKVYTKHRHSQALKDENSSTFSSLNLFRAILYSWLSL